MHFGVDLGRCNPSRWLSVARAADALGFESVWIPEHLVFPKHFSGTPAASLADHPIDPRTPTFDPFVALGVIAGMTQRIRLGTHVFNIGLRHPFVTARAVASLDVLSGGRLTLGIGASWLAEEWDAVGLDFRTRGRRVDECLEVCRRLWSEETVAHRGEFFAFEPVYFEPKPRQRPVPIHVGGDSMAALRRVSRVGHGWIGMIHSPASFADANRTLDGLLAATGRSPGEVERTALAPRPEHGDIEAWSRAGCTRLIVAPWKQSLDAVDSLEEFARSHGIT